MSDKVIYFGGAFLFAVICYFWLKWLIG